MPREFNKTRAQERNSAPSMVNDAEKESVETGDLSSPGCSTEEKLGKSMSEEASVGASVSTERLVQKLVDEFTAFLDESLIRAVVSDFDVECDMEAVREILRPLADSVWAEENTGFDPSGLSSQYLPEPQQGDEPQRQKVEPEPAEGLFGTYQSATTTSSSGEYVTLLSEDNAANLSELSLDTDIPFSDTASLTEDGMVKNLLEIFPSFKVHTIKFVLSSKEVGGDPEKAIDALFSRQTLEQEGHLVKGIDQFAINDDDGGIPLRGNGKRISRLRTKANKEAQRVHVNYKVNSPTIDDDELKEINPGLSGKKALSSYAPPHLRVPTSPARSFAPWQASPSYSSPRPCPIPQVVQSPVATIEKPSRKPPRSTWEVVGPRKAPKKEVPSLPPFSSLNSDLERAHHSLRHASSLVRKGGLYRAGASVYSERAASGGSAARAAQTLCEAEALVDCSASACKIDLHGVSVMDGVRIAKRRVQVWWEEIGAGGGEARRNGFTVVTGVGNHSVGGVSMLRKAVGAALKNDGWKVETLTGEFCVTGKI